MLTVVLTLAVLGAIGALAYWLPRALSALRVDSGVQLAERNAEMERRLQGLNETMDRRLAQLDRKVDHRLESASKTTTQVHERLVKLDEANAQMLERAKELSRLEHALRPPKARGGFGELMLENLLRDRLPATAYSLQYGFKSGERVDAVIKVDRLVPIDSKFPLDNFERMLSAENDIERQQHEKLFG